MIPGTDLGREMAPPLLKAAAAPLTFFLFKSPAQGALTSVWAAAAPGLGAVGSGGRFLGEMTDATPSDQSKDEEATARLWRQSVKATGVSCDLLVKS